MSEELLASAQCHPPVSKAPKKVAKATQQVWAHQKVVDADAGIGAVGGGQVDEDFNKALKNPSKKVVKATQQLWARQKAVDADAGIGAVGGGKVGKDVGGAPS
eukprot:gene16572-22802_t